MARIAIYMRVSTQEQAQFGISLEAQEAKCKAYLEAQGHECVMTFKEEGVSGGKPLATRPQGKLLMLALEQGIIDGVIAISLSRLFRNALDCLHVVEQLEKREQSLILLDMNVDTSTPMGKMFITMSAGFAELERAMIRERTKTVVNHKKKTLQVYGNVPFGFDLVGKNLVPVPEEMATVRRIFEARRNGMSFRAIAGMLTDEGITTKSGNDKWSHQSVVKILSNDIYDRFMEVETC